MNKNKDRPLSVLVVSSKYLPEYAGSAYRAHNTYKRLSAKYNISFEVLAGSVTGNKSRAYRYDNITVHVVARKLFPENKNRNKKNFIWKLIGGFLFRAARCINYFSEAFPVIYFLFKNRSRYNLIHVFGNVYVTSAAVLYAKITGMPLIVELVNLVNDPHQYAPLMVSLFFGKGFPHQTNIVCISPALKQTCLNYGYAENQIWCRPNPVDEDRYFFEPDRKEKYRPALQFADMSEVLLVYVAKFWPLKNQRFLVDVIEKLPDNYKLLLAGPIVGGGPYRNRDHDYYRSLCNAIEEKELTSRVRLMPQFIDDPSAYIKAADVFVMPSTREALGTPVLEALVCGVPVVAHDIPGVFDTWITNGVNGYLCPLDRDVWVSRIVDIKSADKTTMQRVSEEVSAISSTGVIDSQYAELIKNLAV